MSRFCKSHCHERTTEELKKEHTRLFLIRQGGYLGPNQRKTMERIQAILEARARNGSERTST